MKHACWRSVVVALFAFVPLAASGDDDVVLEADTTVGVDGPFLGNANPTRGINGGGLPWVLDEAEGELTRDGSWRSKSKA